MFQKLLPAFFEMPRLYKRLISISLDVAFIVGSLFLAYSLRVGSSLADSLDAPIAYTISITVVMTVLLWAYLGLYRAVIRFLDIKVLSSVFLGSVASGLGLVVCIYLFGADLPRTVPFIYIALVLISTGGTRLVIRGLISAHNGNAKDSVIIYGAGSSGRQLALSLQAGAEYNPVCFVDDSTELQKIQVAGLKVCNPALLESLINKHKVVKLLLAMPSVTKKRRTILLNQLSNLSVEVLTIPGSADLVSGKMKVDVLSHVKIEDLLGREPVKPITRLFTKCITDKNVLVSGAGGSIGSELCRQIVAQKPKKLMLVEASEFALYSIEKELSEWITKQELEIELLPFMLSVQDKRELDKVFATCPIDTIYHAAAYKHVPLVEYNMVSGIRNNVWGTMAMAEVAMEHKVDNFVLVSTDKAVRPTNVMGASKRLSELVLQALAETTSDTTFSMVRFGNVLGSSGSVVPLFKKQISEGGPVTITHPDITRYFMTIPEAAQLVIQAGAMGNSGEVYVLDMGEPIKINDLAKNMIQLMGLTVRNEENPNGDIEVIYSGLRPGEKLYEELLIGGNVEGTEHSRIMKAREVSMTWKDLQALLGKLWQAMDESDMSAVREILLSAPLGYSPSSGITDCLWTAAQNNTKPAKVETEHLRVVDGSK